MGSIFSVPKDVFNGEECYTEKNDLVVPFTATAYILMRTATSGIQKLSSREGGLQKRGAVSPEESESLVPHLPSLLLCKGEEQKKQEAQ